MEQTTDISAAITALLADKKAMPDAQWALQCLGSHPSFVVLAALLTARSPEGIGADQMLSLKTRVALGCPDREAICDLADLSGCQWDGFYPAPAPKQEKTTEETIDDFISTYGNRSEQEDAMLEKLIFNPVPADYFPGLDQPADPDNPLALPPELDPDATVPIIPEDKAPAAPETSEATMAEAAAPGDPAPDQEAARQESTQPEAARQAEAPEPAQGAEGKSPALMESLAEFFVKQQRYERAFEIIKNLSLNYPEKSAYFADQLRFLQKLIDNQRRLERLKS